MIKFTGHELDAVVVPHRRQRGAGPAAAAARRDRRSLRRHRGRHPAPPGGLRRADRAAHRRLPRPQPAHRGRRHGRGRRGHRADLRGARRRPRELSPRGRMGFRDRGVEIKTPDQIAKMRVAGLLVGRDPRAAALARCAPASPPASSTRSPRRTSAPAAGCPPSWATATRRSRPRSAPRSTTRWCTASRATGCSQDGDVISIDCGAIVDGWHGDAAITVRGRRGAARRARADAGHRGVACGPGIAAARLGGRVTDISHAVEAYVRVAAAPVGRQLRHPRGLHRPRHRHRDAPAAQRAQLRPPRPGPQARARAGARGRADGHAGQQAHRPRRRTSGPCVTDDGSWAAHFEHTFTLTPDGAWVLTALDGGRGRCSAELGVPYGGD